MILIGPFCFNFPLLLSLQVENLTCLTLIQYFFISTAFFLKMNKSEKIIYF